MVVLMLLVVILLAQLKEKIIKYISMSVQRVATVTCCPFPTCTGQDTDGIYSYISQGSLSIGPHNHELNTYSVI